MEQKIIRVQSLRCPQCHQEIGNLNSYPSPLRESLLVMWNGLSYALAVAKMNDLGDWYVCFHCGDILTTGANEETLTAPRLENWTRAIADPKFVTILKEAQKLLAEARRLKSLNEPEQTRRFCRLNARIE